MIPRIQNNNQGNGNAMESTRMDALEAEVHDLKFLVAQLQMRDLTKSNEIRHLQGAVAELRKQIERLERQISAAGGLMAPAA
jgi:polyhydroxyalkanoate synthesis regulator phasin